MTTRITIFMLVSLFVLATGISLHAQDEVKIPAASPLQSIEQEFGQNKISIQYSRPGKKGRKIFGELVPYGKIWRTGANASSKIKFGGDVIVAGQSVPAGEYALYTVPGKDMWEIIFHKNTSYWGDGGPSYKKEEDQLRFKVKPETLGKEVETFTIAFEHLSSTAVDVALMWDKTRVIFTVKADLAAIFANIEKGLAAAPEDKRPYYSAAQFYLDNGGDLNKALQWADSSEKQYPDNYWSLQLRARILMRQGKFKEAIESLNQSNEIAKKVLKDDPDAQYYMDTNNKLLAEARKKS